MHWRRGLVGFLFFVVGLAAVEGACRLLPIDRVCAEELLDIQTPDQLIAKLHYLEHFDGYKIVLLGDSVIYGGILQDFGDDQWREHALTARLQAKFAAEFPGKKALIMNLGINGALPADIECIARLIAPCQPDLVILDTHLRPFSADFAKAGSTMVRPWLRDLVREQDGTIHLHTAKAGWCIGLNDWAANWLRNHVTLFRCRATVQTLLSQATWPHRFADIRHWLNGTTPVPAVSGVEQDPLILLLQFKKRFSTVSLEADHAQVLALRQTLKCFKDHQQKTVVFYVKENPDQIDGVVDEADHRQFYDQLTGILSEGAGPHLTYVPPIAELEGRHFLDLSHPNQEGYQILTEHLWKAIFGQEGGTTP